MPSHSPKRTAVAAAAQSFSLPPKCSRIAALLLPLPRVYMPETGCLASEKPERRCRLDNTQRARKRERARAYVGTLSFNILSGRITEWTWRERERAASQRPVNPRPHARSAAALIVHSRDTFYLSALSLSFSHARSLPPRCIMRGIFLTHSSKSQGPITSRSERAEILFPLTRDLRARCTPSHAARHALFISAWRN